MRSYGGRLSDERPPTLTHKEAVALSGELYRAWANGADERRERTYSVTLDPKTRLPIPDTGDESAETIPAYWAASREALEKLKAQDDAFRERVARGLPNPPNHKRPMEAAFGRIVDALLSQQAITRLEPASHEMVLEEFRRAMMDAFDARQRKAKGDYSPDPSAARFPQVEESFSAAPPVRTSKGARPKVSLKGLYEEWWKEAKAAGRSESTNDSYARTFRVLGRFLGHDDASRVSADDIQRFKSYRREQGASIKTVRDGDISALKSVFGWAVDNGRLTLNPAANVKMVAAKTSHARERASTEKEAAAILRHASDYQSDNKRETPKVAAAKRCVPWLCAYSGARVGEVTQLRKEDIGQEGEISYFTITPEAGTVKDKKKRVVVIHEHLIEVGFLDFVKGSAPG